MENGGEEKKNQMNQGYWEKIKKKNKQKKNKPQEEIGLGSKKDCTQHQIIFFLLTLVLDSKQNKPAIG